MADAELELVLRHARRLAGPDAPEADDAALLRRFAEGRDAGAFEVLVRRRAQHQGTGDPATAAPGRANE
jgi:hypothetical protein